ncbi:ankyrin repeat and SOCS box protein 15 isoform X2 [Silurus meridionalis]|uniref:ankyrin repeat and SOCS box protein 15 isoform X2 n=1 Tax=Silurus meridionalis TaxID=175797 RepID=UPI001EE9D0B9|nr:ankyrin repeat and SOCS box protein 15 isoform X2 [Silurus meridionalis]
MNSTDEVDEDDQLLNYAIQLSLQESWINDFPASVENQKIFDAIKRGDLYTLQEMSEYPAAFTEVDAKGWYPLHRAAVQQSVQVLERVIYASYRLTLDEETADRETPLTLATQAGLVEIVCTLLDHGASPHRTNGRNESPLLLAVRTDSYEIALALIKRGALVNQVCLKKWTAVHEAAKVGCVDILKLLLQHGGHVSETDQHGVTPMGIAAEYAQAEVLDILIHNGGDVNAQAPNGDSVLYDAAGSGNPDCIDLLLQNGSNPNIANLSSQLPIHRAAYEGHYLALRMLVPITTRRALRLAGQSPVHSAADGGHAQCLQLLLKKGFDLLLRAGAKPDLDPLSCLLVAVRAGRYEIVKLLLANGANVNYCFTVVNDTLFPTALQYSLRDEMMMRMLLNSGYDADKCFVCHHDSTWTDRSHHSDHSNDKIPFCDFISVSWLVQYAGKAVQVLLDYVGHVPICSKLKMVLQKHKEWPEMCHILGNPRSLKHMCRLLIRRQMTPRRLGDQGIINSAPFPPLLKKYLMYREHDLYGSLCADE